MSDEGKELLEALAVMYNRFCDKSPSDTQLITEAYDRIRQRLQQSEIDEKRKEREYLIEKLESMFSCAMILMGTENIKEEILEEYKKATKQIRQLLQQQPEIEVSEAFIQAQTKYIAEYPSQHRVEETLKKAGVKINS